MPPKSKVELFAAIRTVQGHLQRAYTELRVTGRSELGRVLCQPG